MYNNRTRNGNMVPIPPQKPMPPRAHWNPEHIGVTTSEDALYEMSGFDRLIASQFNPVYQKYGRVTENKYESFAYRTAADKNMLQKFDPIYNKDMVVREQYAPSGCASGSCGGGCGGGGCGKGSCGGPMQKGHSHLFDDVYQPYSYSVTYPDQH